MIFNNQKIKLLNLSEQKGASLIITFLIMTILLAVVLSVSTILFNKIKIISNIGASLSSLNAANSGIEKTLYFDRKQIPSGATRGFCNICSACSNADCINCTSTSLSAGAINGCDLVGCLNCRITYDSTFNGRNYTVDAKVFPDPLNSAVSNFNINSKGFYRDTTRTVVFSGTTTTVAQNPVPTTTSIFPTSAEKGSSAFTLTVNGTNFISSSVVNFNGSPRSTTFVSSTRLKAQIPASDLTTVGAYPITVTNPAPGGGTSNSQIFMVRT